MTVVEGAFFVAGGNLGPGAASYVARDADRELFDALLGGEFCYVLDSRQVGKSSLRVHTAARLEQAGAAVAQIDLTSLGTASNTIEQWYYGLLHRLGRQLGLAEALERFWTARERLGPLQRWVAALQEVVLSRCDRVVIFLDEIDSLRQLPFSKDEFLAAIRSCYDRRTVEPEFRRLTFCLVGTATPSDLIQDPRATPFNIGRRIPLRDFTEREAAHLAQGLPQPPAVAAAILRRVFYWTGGHPYLTQRLCEQVAERHRFTDAGRLVVAGRSPSRTARSSTLLRRLPKVAGSRVPDAAQPSQAVDRACEELFLLREPEHTDHLEIVSQRLLESEADRAGLLTLYARVYRAGVPEERPAPLCRALQRLGLRQLYPPRFHSPPVRDDDTNPLVAVLRLSGLVRGAGAHEGGRTTPGDRGALRVRNRIYERVFGPRWIASNMPDAELRRQRAAYRRGVLRATAIAGVILAAMTGLAWVALREAYRADRSARRAGASARQAGAALLAARQERDRADQEARRANRTAEGARASERRERAAREQAEAARAGEEDERRRADEQRQRAIEQRQVALEQRARAERERRHAARAEQAMRQQLRESYLAQAQALRRSGSPGQRVESLAILARAARIHPSLQLRNEAIAAMALPDLQLAAEWPVDVRGIGMGIIDPSFRLYVRGDPSGSISVRRTRSDRELFRLPGAGATLLCGFFSPDVRFLAVNDSADRLRVWDLERRERALDVPRGSWGEAIAFRPDGREVASSDREGTLTLYSLPDGSPVERFSLGMEPKLICFSPEGRRLAVSSLSGVVQIWNLNPARRLRALRYPASIRYIAWHPDGTCLAAPCGDRSVYVHEVSSGRLVARLEAHKAEAKTVCFTHDGDLLSSVGWDDTLRLWDAHTWEPLITLPFGVDARFSADDQFVGPELYRQSMRFWRLIRNWEHRTITGRAQRVTAAAVGPDGRLMAVADENGAWLWSLETARLLAHLTDQQVYSVCFHPSGRALLTSGPSGTHIWPIERDGDHANRPPAIGPSRAVILEDRPGHVCPGTSHRADLSRDGRTLAVIHDQGPTKHVHVIRLEMPSPQVVLPVGNRARDKVAISPDGRWVAMGCWGDTGVEIWDARASPCHRRVRFLTSVRGNASAIFSPDGRWLVTGCGEEYRFWRVGSWRQGPGVVRLDVHNLPGEMAFSPDGSTLAVAADARAVAKLIDFPSGRELATLEAPQKDVWPLFFTPDGGKLATRDVDGAVHLWDLRRVRKQLAAMGLDWKRPPHPPAPQSLAKRPRGTTVSSIEPAEVSQGQP